MRKFALLTLLLLTLTVLVCVAWSSKLHAVRFATRVAKGLRKVKKLTPVLMMIRKKPIILVIKKNVYHPSASPLDLGVRGTALTASDWIPGLDIPSLDGFPYHVHTL